MENLNNFTMDSKNMELTDEQLLRRKAEEQLKKTQEKTNRQVIKSDIKKLLHELQVHQIELEMQNEELCHAIATSEEALKKFTMLYEFAPMGYFTLDRNCIISELNFTGAEILGEKRFSLINSNFKLFVTEDSKSVFNEFFDKVYSTQSKESCEVKLGYDGRPFCEVYMEGVVTDDDQKCLLSVVDISSFKK